MGPSLLLLWACTGTEGPATETEALTGLTSSDTETVTHSDSAAETGDTGVDTGFACDTRLQPGEAIDLDAACAEPEAFPWTPEVLWQRTSFSATTTHDIVRVSPIVGRWVDSDGDGALDEDDVPVVVISADDGSGSSQTGMLHVLSGTDGSEYESYETVSWDGAAFTVAQQAGVALGDVDGDGWTELVTTVLAEDGTAHLAALSRDGSALWVATELALPFSRGYPAIADLDADGEPEVVLGASWVAGSDGTWLASGALGEGAETGNVPVSVPVDLDADGTLEVLVGNGVYEHDGSTLCTLDGYDDFPSTADLEGDGSPEIVVTGRGQIRIFDADCDLVTSWEVTGAVRGGPAALGDLSGDGRDEIVVVIEDGIEVYTLSGTLLWSQIIGEGSGRSTPTLFDFDGDGELEIVHADEGALRVFSGRGAVLFEDGDHDSATSLEGVAISDVDGDGDAELVVADAGYSSYGRQTGVTVWHGGEVPFPEVRPLFSQHAWYDSHIDDLGAVSTDAPYGLHNTFRAAIAEGGHPEALPNGRLVLGEACTDDCERGRVVLTVHVANDGGADLLAGTPVAVYAVRDGAGDLLATSELPEEVPPGESSDSLLFVLDAAEVDGADLRVLVDDDGTLTGVVEECHEDDNILTLEGPFCP